MWWTFGVPVVLILGAALVLKKMMDVAWLADQMDEWQRVDQERKARERRQAWDWHEEWERYVAELPETDEPIRPSV